MKTLVESLAQGIRFRPKHAVTELAKDGNNWRVSCSKKTILAQQVVLSTPANVAATLVKSLDCQLAKYLAGIEMAPLAVVHLGFSRAAIRHPLDGTGFLTPRREKFAVTGCLWMSSLFPDRAPQDKVLFSSYLGGATQPEAIDWDDERSVAAVMETLQPLLGVDCDPENMRIDRHQQGLPLYHGNYTGRMVEIAKHLVYLPGLHLEANYRGGVSVRDRIARAAEVAGRILEGRKV